ncbi:MAG: paraquat-inducible protein A [Pseudomonadota bacterium]|nr:paraquat-inducible protein A [Pseudomonadota bacterium]
MSAIVIACPNCATIQAMPPPRRRGRIECRCCGDVLERTGGRSLDGALACALATLLLLIPANALTLLTVRAPAGLTGTTHLFSGIAAIWRQGWPLMAVVCGLEGVILPFVRFGLLVAALTGIKLGVRQGWVGPVFRYAELLDAWAMADVFLIGGAIGFGRVAALIPVRIEEGGYCLIGAALMTMITRACLDRRAVWRRIARPNYAPAPDCVACTTCDLVLPASLVGGRCPRCAARLHRRKPFALMRSGALVAAAWLLLPISNLFPMSAYYETGVPHPHTIFAGIKLLFENGYAPLGVLILCTSMGIPLFKLVGMSWFFISVRQHSASRLRIKTRVYRIIHEVGRWSNLDPFTVVIFVPMVQFGQLAHIAVHGGSPAFLAVVVLSMLAARVFDPRLMWDAAARAGRTGRSGQN